MKGAQFCAVRFDSKRAGADPVAALRGMYNIQERDLLRLARQKMPAIDSTL